MAIKRGFEEVAEEESKPMEANKSSGRQLVASNRPWDPVAYSRAVRVGNLVEVAGTTSVGPDGKVLFPGEMYEQTKECLRVILSALEELGAGASDVVRTRMFLTDIEQWGEAGRAHREIFEEIRPASSMVECTRLLDPEYLIEVEATAIVAQDDPRRYPNVQ